MSKFVLQKYDTKVKVTFFFHDFKPRESNPEGFDSKIKNWMHVIEEFVYERKDALISIDLLKKQLDTFGIKPSINCLRLVLANLLHLDEIISENDFLQKYGNKKSAAGDSWIGWGLSNVKKIFSWGMNSQSDSFYIEKIDESIGEKHQFVCLKALERWAFELFNLVNRLGLTNQCLEFENLEEKIQEKLNIKDYGLELILLYLQNKNQCSFFKEGAIKLVKFGEDAVIDQRDCALFRLKVTKNEILKQIEDTESEIVQTLEKAREQIRNGNKFKAKQLLRRKQRLEMFYEKQQKIYDTIESSESKIQQTDSNKLVVETMNDFAAVYKGIQPNLEDVQSLQENMDEIVEKEDKYNQAIDLLSKASGQFDETALEQELNEILNENLVETNLKNLSSTSANSSPNLMDLETRLKRLRQSNNSPNAQSKRNGYGLYDD